MRIYKPKLCVKYFYITNGNNIQMKEKLQQNKTHGKKILYLFCKKNLDMLSPPI